MIPCIVIPEQRSSVFRQAKENTARSGLTAVALARQAALLLLTVHGYEIPAYAVNNDFYRQALDLDLRGKREYTDAILSAMGGIEKAQFSRIKALLRLSDEALGTRGSPRYRENKLRYVVGFSTRNTTPKLSARSSTSTSAANRSRSFAKATIQERVTDDLLDKLPAAAVKMAQADANRQHDVGSRPCPRPAAAGRRCRSCARTAASTAKAHFRSRTLSGDE